MAARKDRKSSNTDFQGGISGSIPLISSLLFPCRLEQCPKSPETHSFGLEPLNNGESSRIMYILHDEPIDRLPVFAVDPGCFDEFGFEAGDGIRVVVGVEMDRYGVDHFECCADSSVRAT